MKLADRKPVTPRQAAELYAARKTSEGWCIDTSISPLRAFHIKGDTHASMDELKLGFNAFAMSQGIRVEDASKKDFEYGTFINSLPGRLASCMWRIVGTAMKPVPQAIFTNEHGLSYANTFIQFAPEMKGDFVMPPLLDKYLKNLLPNARDRRLVVQWMADIIQNPTRQVDWAVYLMGDEGTGKSTLFRLVTMALGGNHTHALGDYEQLFEKHGSIQADSLLVHIEDAPANKRTRERLKSVIGRRHMHVNAKYAAKLQPRDVYGRILISCNTNSSVKFLPGENYRRTFMPELCVHPTGDKADTDKFFVEFNALLDEPGTPAIIRQWLMQVDLSDFNPGFTIETDTQKALAGLSTSVLESTLAGLIAHEEGELPPVIAKVAVLARLKEEGFHFPNPDDIKHRMDKLGYETKRRKVTGLVNGAAVSKQVDVWQPKPTKRASPPLTPEREQAIFDVATHAY
jgi:hypothetical protein